MMSLTVPSCSITEHPLKLGILVVKVVPHIRTSSCLYTYFFFVEEVVVVFAEFRSKLLHTICLIVWLVSSL